MDDKKSFIDSYGTILHTLCVALVTWGVLGAAICASYYYPTEQSQQIRIFPISFDTATWLISLLFPLTSTFYLLFDLRLRKNQIEDAADRGQVQFVYYPRNITRMRDFSRLLRQRFRETCQPWKLAAFSTIAGAIAFVGIVLVFYNAFKPVEIQGFAELQMQGFATFGQYYGEIDQSRLSIFTAFAGSLAGALVYIFNKFRTFDIYPSTYLQSSIGFIVGSLGAIFVGSIYPSAPLDFLCFAIGFLTAINVASLSSLLRRQVAKTTGVTLPEDTEGDLNSIVDNAGAIESLHNIAIYSVADLVKADPLTIYLSLPTPIGVINGWFNEGLLLYYFGKAAKDKEETELMAVLRSVGVRRFTQLIGLAIETWPGLGNGITCIKWKQKIPLIDSAELETVLREQARCIVESRVHNRLLGILSDPYREAVFLISPV